MTTNENFTNIEEMQIGHRYVETIKGYEDGWKVSTIEQTDEFVQVTYKNGRTVSGRKGEQIATFCDVQS